MDQGENKEVLHKTPSTIGDSDGRAHIEIVGKLLRDTAGCHGLHEHRKPSSYGQFHGAVSTSSSERMLCG